MEDVIRFGPEGRVSRVALDLEPHTVFVGEHPPGGASARPLGATRPDDPPPRKLQQTRSAARAAPTATCRVTLAGVSRDTTAESASSSKGSRTRPGLTRLNRTV